MTAFQRSLRLLFFFAAAAPFPATAFDAALCAGKPASVRISDVADGSSLQLADGRIVRLASVIAPVSMDGDPDATVLAKATLAEIAKGKDAVVYLASDAQDRYGRVSANAVRVEGKIWLETELLVRGMTRVFPSANDECMKALLVHEEKARLAQSGIWARKNFAMFAATDVAPMLASAGRFAVVEGTVRRVGEARGRLYLDFGTRFTEDFTIVVPENVRKSLAARGLDPKGWRGRRIRVRGILFSWGGPAIEINLAQAIELLDQEIPKSE